MHDRQPCLSRGERKIVRSLKAFRVTEANLLPAFGPNFVSFSAQRP